MGNQSKCDEIDECLEELGTFVCDNLCCHRQEDLLQETPYITIEICGTQILQWYGIRDTKPDEIRIERHLRRYIKALKEKDQIKSVTA